MIDTKQKPLNLSPKATDYADNLPLNQDYFLREPEVRQISGLCKETRRKMEKTGCFPKRVKLGRYAIGWLKSEIDTWLAECIAERNSNANTQKGGIA